MKNKLNLGCGKKIYNDFINVDIIPNKGVDVLWDLNVSPLPFTDSSFDYILMDNVFEHIQNRVQLLKEIERIGKDGAIIEIIIPHFSSYTAYREVEHCFYCSYFAFDTTDLEIIKRKFECFKGLPFKKVFDFIANLSPMLTDIYFHKVLPIQTLVFKLKVNKNETDK